MYVYLFIYDYYILCFFFTYSNKEYYIIMIKYLYYLFFICY